MGSQCSLSAVFVNLMANALRIEKNLNRLKILARWRLPCEYIKGAFRLDAKQREAKIGDLRQPSRVVDYVTREGCQPSRVVANLRDWSLHRLILIT